MAEDIDRQGLLHLRAWRTWRGMSQRELAARSSVSFTTINRLETGANAHANWETVRKLADGLGITREQLLHTDPA